MQTVDAGPDATATGSESGAAFESGSDATPSDATAPGDAGDAGGNTCIPPPPGIVSWWRADGDFIDSIGGNSGTNAGGVTFTPGEVGPALSLSGASNSYVFVGDAPSLELTGAITIDAWVSSPAFGGRIVDKIQAYGSNGYMLDTYQDRLRMNVGPNAVSSTTLLPMGAMTHVAGVYDGSSSITLYVNGSLVGTGSFTPQTTPTSQLPLRIGADSNGTSLFTGIIDEVRLFGRALSAVEILAIYRAGGAARCP
jgi:hypothetical protein